MEDDINDENEIYNNLYNQKTYEYNYLLDEKNNNKNYDDNELYIGENNNENNKLKDEIQKLNMNLKEKNEEIEEIKAKYDNQLIQINQSLDNHINEYQELVQNYENIQQDLKKTRSELQQKNKIINELKANQNIIQGNANNNNFNNSPNKMLIQLIMILKDKIKNLYANFFMKRNNEKINKDIYLVLDEFENIFNNNKDIESKLKSLIQFTNFISKELSEFKLKISNKPVLKGNLNENEKSIFQKFYLEFIDIMNNFISNISFNFFNFNNFPKFSLNDTDEKKYKDILFIFNKLTSFIIEYQNNNNNDINYNNINKELEKKLNEMSELLDNSNNYLNIARKENKELKIKYNELEQKYLNIIDFDNINEKLNNELNKKNQQIKSLENMVTILTNKASKNKNMNHNLNNTTSRSMMLSNSFCGKIINKKIYNEMKSNFSKSSFYLNNNKNNKFIKDEKKEKNLNKFLNKYTNGEYGNNINNNVGIINLKEEIEKYEKEIEPKLSDDEIEKDNNYNEEEEEKKFQMEGKI